MAVLAVWMAEKRSHFQIATMNPSSELESKKPQISEPRDSMTGDEMNTQQPHSEADHSSGPHCYWEEEEEEQQQKTLPCFTSELYRAILTGSLSDSSLLALVSIDFQSTFVPPLFQSSQ